MSERIRAKLTGILDTHNRQRGVQEGRTRVAQMLEIMIEGEEHGEQLLVDPKDLLAAYDGQTHGGYRTENPHRQGKKGIAELTNRLKQHGVTVRTVYIVEIDE